MARHFFASVLILMLWCMGTSTGLAQTQFNPADIKLERYYPPLPKITSPRLYVIDCGTQLSHSLEPWGIKLEEGVFSIHPLPCFLVMHPKGIMLFEAGLSDDMVGRPYYENTLGGTRTSFIKQTTLKGELANIGVSPAKINYFAISHGHFDHVGNGNDYAGSTWLARKAEYDWMFGPDYWPSNVRDDFAKLKQAPTKFIEGDYDVFGDGTVILLSTPGHTPGHQSLYVKLERTGGVVVSGDLYHRIKEREKGFVPERERNTETPASRKRVDEFLKRTNSQLWIGHDALWFRDAVKSPGWYE